MSSNLLAVPRSEAASLEVEALPDRDATSPLPTIWMDLRRSSDQGTAPTSEISAG
jgi:hypothetical protein